MDQEIREIRAELKQIGDLSKDNNAMLHGIQRRAQLSMVFSALRWIVIIGLTVGAYYSLLPYLKELTSVYQKVSGSKLDFMNLFRGF